jgi:hypothetical protein
MKDPTFGFGTAFVLQFPPWQFWALVTPAVLGLGRRCRLEAGSWAPSIAAHLVFNLLLAAGHVSVVFGLAPVWGLSRSLCGSWPR